MKKVFSFLFFVITISACTAERNRSGTQAEMRIVSLAPSLTKNLYFLEAQEKIVGITSFCVEIENSVIAASAIAPNIERIVALRPDLVLVAGTLTSSESIATLRRFGIRVEIFDSANSFDEICEQFLHLGELIGKKAKAEHIVSESRERVNIILEKMRMRWQQPPSVFFQIGANPLFTVLPNTFMDDYIRFFGGRNISENLRTGIIGREFVIAKNPDFIFIATMGAVSEEEKNVWSRHSQMSAARNGQIFTIDADIVCLPTPITFAETMEILYELTLQ